MSTGAMRRAQLVTPFGVGAMSILVNGTSVITAGLDHWFEDEGSSLLALEEYQEHDWRLEARLHVSEFRLPPDYRTQGSGGDNRNVRLIVPVLRFPLWCFCPYCKRLERDGAKSTLTMQQSVLCPDPSHSDWKHRPRMSQVPFVAICAAGHLDDFPFDKWVHRSHQPTCKGPMRLRSMGGGGLEGQQVVCEGCNRQRSLRGITGRPTQDNDRTNLSQQLVSPEDPYLCTGARPWLGQMSGPCSLPMQGALRAAGNVYFPKVESSIYLPRQEGAVSAEVHELMRHPAVSVTMRTLHNVFGDDLDVAMLRSNLQKNVPVELFEPIGDEELLAAYRDLFGVGAEMPQSGEESSEDVLTGNDEWRHPEFQRIRETPSDERLSAMDPGMHPDLESLFARVRSVDALRETRALRGFTRVRDDNLRLSVGKALLRGNPLPPTHDWLPAYVVQGEGIYLELETSRLEEWEARRDVQARVQKIIDHHGAAALARGVQGRELTPRFVLLHTLSHLLINELIFSCGYSSASLRERLYASTKEGAEMAGLLIYTAAGDSEGTMGGLVRMSRPENLRTVVAAAVAGARWCSTDPVCMDAGERGQGPDSCNLAACHGCALLPETSCEEFNRFLDRGIVIGTFDNPTLGFFSSFS